MAYRDYDYYMDTHRLRIAVRRPAGGKAGESLGAGAGLRAWHLHGEGEWRRRKGYVCS